MRVIMLIDMDYFFVACEEIKRPELKQKPTIVGADPKEGKGRGVVMTCNYAARKFGIHSAMPISQAYKIKPDAEYLPMDYSYYESKSNEVFSIIKTFAEKVEQVSIDEFFIDLSVTLSEASDALEYAKRIKEAIATRAKLPCSIGISENKLIAKMACEKAKPSGIKLVRGADAKSFIAKMKLGELYGIGSKTEERLNALGYTTAEELAKASIMSLMENFGSFGIELHNIANAIDESEVVEAGDAKSISREQTFESDTSNPAEISSSIRRLASELGTELESKKISFKTIGIKLRYSDFSESLHGRTIRQTNQPGQIAETALSLFKENSEGRRKIRKLGVRVSGLTSYRSQKSLF